MQEINANKGLIKNILGYSNIPDLYFGNFLNMTNRVDRMFDTNQVQQPFSTDTMHMTHKSIKGFKYAQVFGTKDFFVLVYPIVSKAEAGDTLAKFIRDYGAPKELCFDGSKEQVQRGTKFQAAIPKYDIKGRIRELKQPNQNTAEGLIQELRKI